MKIISKIKKAYVGLFLMLAALGTTSCQSGLTYEEVPESYYTDVNLSSCTVLSRYLFEDCIYAKNFGTYTTYISQSSFGAEREWTNESGSSYTLADGSVVAPGEKVVLKSGVANMTTRDDNNAPEGKIYVMTYYVPKTVTYTTANKGYLFDQSKLPSGFKCEEPTDGMSEKATAAVDIKQLVVTMQTKQWYGDACTFTPVNGAPKLGAPGDYSEPRQYLVKNNMRRPAGVPQSMRIYEIRIVVLP